MPCNRNKAIHPLAARNSQLANSDLIQGNGREDRRAVIASAFTPWPWRGEGVVPVPCGSDLGIGSPTGKGLPAANQKTHRVPALLSHQRPR
jgi:hypothetical protein